MKVQSHIEMLKAFAKLLLSQGNAQLATGMDRLADALSPAANWNVEALTKKSVRPSQQSESMGGVKVGDVANALTQFEVIARPIAKPNYLTDLTKIISWLDAHKTESLESFI